LAGLCSCHRDHLALDGSGKADAATIAICLADAFD